MQRKPEEPIVEIKSSCQLLEALIVEFNSWKKAEIVQWCNEKAAQ